MTPTPHDALFKATFSQPARAGELLRSLLDPALCARIDWSSLALHPGSFVADDLRSQHADLLFTALLDGREVRLYLLLEHQSAPDPWIALWLLRYMVGIWVDHLAAHPKSRRLPPILPVVLHHGDRAWTIDPEFSVLVDSPADFAAFTPRFRFAYADLTVVDADTLRTTHQDSAATLLALLALKETRAANSLRDLLLGWASILHALEREPDGDRAIDFVIRYLAHVRGAPEFGRTDFQTLGLGKTSEALMITYADYLLEQGREQGHAKGHAKGRAEGLQEGEQRLFLKLLRSKFTRVPREVTARVETAALDDLERWSLNLLGAMTLDDVFAAAPAPLDG